MNRKQADSRTRRLIDAALSGRLTGDEARELDRLLRDDDAAIDMLLAYCQLETDLFFHVRATLAGRRFLADMEADMADMEMAETLAAEVETRRVSEERDHRVSGSLADASGYRAVRRQSKRLLVAMAAVVVVGAVVSWSRSEWSYWYVIPAERQPRPIASLAEGRGAEWDDVRLPTGHRFVEGDSLRLAKGRARISMASGAELVLRAPCFVTLASADRVRLEQGVVTAQVAEWGRGFTVSTDALNVVDLGTKFAVSASAMGTAEAHVLAGQIRVEPTSLDLPDRRSLLLSVGEAIRIESGRHIAQRLAADRQRFDAEMGNLAPFKPIPIFNTGAGLVPGDEDPHWRITAGPKSDHFQVPEFAVVAEADVRYLANDPARSQWISVSNPVRPGVTPNSTFTFECTFDLSGYDLATVTLAAQVIADNGVRAIRINGRPISITPWELNEPQQYFNKFQPVEIREGFVPGFNRVEFDVWNGVDRSAEKNPNPMSLRVEWQAFGRLAQLAANGASRSNSVAQYGAPTLRGAGIRRNDEATTTGASEFAKRI